MLSFLLVCQVLPFLLKPIDLLNREASHIDLCRGSLETNAVMLNRHITENRAVVFDLL